MPVVLISERSVKYFHALDYVAIARDCGGGSVYATGSGRCRPVLREPAAVRWVVISRPPSFSERWQRDNGLDLCLAIPIER